ncbi:MAG: large conductance mechanosensitive channel protein MscL [Eubacterium sp.]|nr:large conductance mechanosensitive channel protein MscL [Eubacterium sp.]
MKKFFDEFKAFISRGSVMDLAVGMIIGAAFTAIVTSLVDDIIMPIVSLASGGVSVNQIGIHLAGGGVIAIGNFIGAIINFIIIAFVIFCIIKALNKAQSLVKKPEEEAAPVTKICPFCQSEINIAATRCPMCTSELK